MTRNLASAYFVPMTETTSHTLAPQSARPDRTGRTLLIAAVALLALTTLFAALCFLQLHTANARDKGYWECNYRYDNSKMDYDSDEYNQMASKQDNCVANLYGLDR
jgi:hypothetical protein